MAKEAAEIRPRLSRIDFFRHRGPDFFQALFRCIDQELGEGDGRAIRWSGLNPYQQGLHAWWTFWGDVLNGGLAQYFYNHTDFAVPALDELLKTASCLPMARLLE
ncbi:MAG TPA: hypothetical protein VHV47_01565, partial [Opitutaceae bacterium]|nr:hypothetical protein [Opitutaceae bacterium]